ncbi:hypothetical protein M5K25_007680 [Dendrobium thyrsiflorum]|uniref:Reverse transcriptase zinc-binding domain-containing protein n=1 Tax=Dendrobium thyrsiflorum TaxID=117978 RepID=A0ABD0VM54_DENTH
MYKNFWSKHTDFWSLLVAVFDETCHENHISWFYKRLKHLKSLIKRKDWASSNDIAAKCKSLEVQQLNCQMLLDNDPQNGELCSRLKNINGELNFYYSSWSSWTVQRSKVNWLTKGEDDLKFLFSKVRNRSSSNAHALKAFLLGPDSNYQSPASILWNHWCMGIKLFNHFADLCRNFYAILKWETVKDWTNNSSWNLPSYIGYDTANELNNLLSSIPILSNVTSNIVWKDNSKATYKDFYKEYFEREASVDWHHFVWHKNKALRFSVFSWLALMGGLKTVDALARRNIYMTDPICPLCRCDLESLNHLFFECYYSFTILVKLIPNFQYFYLRPSLIQSLNHVGSIAGTKLEKQGLLLTLNATVYYLWRERNNRRFGSSSHCVVTTTNLIAKVIKYKLSQRNYMEYGKN